MATIKAEIDASVFTAAGAALGRISGPLEFLAVPRTGDVVSLIFSPNGSGDAQTWALQLQPKVKTVIHMPGPSARVLLVLEPIVVESEENARHLAEYVGTGFDLFYEPYSE